MRVFMNKSCLYLLTGCTVFLCIGTRVQSAYAVDYPSIETLKEHLKKSQFGNTFRVLYLYSRMVKFSLLSENPGNGKQVPSFTMHFNGKGKSFQNRFRFEPIAV